MKSNINGIPCWLLWELRIQFARIVLKQYHVLYKFCVAIEKTTKHSKDTTVLNQISCLACQGGLLLLASKNCFYEKLIKETWVIERSMSCEPILVSSSGRACFLNALFVVFCYILFVDARWRMQRLTGYYGYSGGGCDNVIRFVNLDSRVTL